MADDFTRGDAFDIAHSSTVDAAGQDHVRDPSATLLDYGISTGEQADLVKKNVRTNDAIGLPSYERRISPNALKDLTRSWTIGKLRDVIFDFSEPISEERVFAAGRSRSLGEAPAPAPESRQDTMMMMAVAAAAGMMVGFLLGRRR